MSGLVGRGAVGLIVATNNCVLSLRHPGAERQQGGSPRKSREASEEEQLLNPLLSGGSPGKGRVSTQCFLVKK